MGKRIPSANPHPEGVPRNCPRDNSLLTPRRYETEEVDQCPTCGGVWCDNVELGEIVRTRETSFATTDYPEIKALEGKKTSDPQKDSTNAEAGCVVCHAPMSRVNYSHSSGIFIDRCQQGHGVWLDRNELEKIQVFAERWNDSAPALEEKYGTVLKQIALVASAQHDKALRDAGRQVRSRSLLGRIFGRAWRRF